MVGFKRMRRSSLADSTSDSMGPGRPTLNMDFVNSSHKINFHESSPLSHSEGLGARTRPPRGVTFLVSNDGIWSLAWWKDWLNPDSRKLRIKSARADIQSFVNKPLYLIVSVPFAVYNLLADQFRLAFCTKNCDPGFRVFNTLIFLVFLLEVILLSYFKDGYVTDLSNGNEPSKDTNAFSPPSSPMGGSRPLPTKFERETKAPKPPKGGNGYMTWLKDHRKKPHFFFLLDLLAVFLLLIDPTFDSYMSNNNRLHDMLSLRSSRVRFKATRVIRLLRALSLFHLIHRTLRPEKPPRVQVPNDGALMTQTTRPGLTQGPEGRQRAASLACTTMHGGQMDLMASTMSVKDITGPSSFASTQSTWKDLSPFGSASYLSAVVFEDVQIKIIIGAILLLVVAPLLSYNAKDSTWAYTAGLIDYLGQQGAGTPERQQAVRMIDQEYGGKVDLLEVGGTLWLDQTENLRKEEFAQWVLRSRGRVLQNIQPESRFWTRQGIISMIATLLLIIGLVVWMHSDLRRLVFEPLAQMVSLVDRISCNPLAPIPEAEILSTQGPAEEQGGPEDGRRSSFTRSNARLEPTLLLQTIGKIGTLVKIGLGAAGADIIARSLQESGTYKLSLKTSGKPTSSIFVFCDIRNFTDTTECLQEEVMVFVNKIAALIHTFTVQCGGAPNKNIGDAFLLVWKIADLDEKKRSESPNNKWDEDIGRKTRMLPAPTDDDSEDEPDLASTREDKATPMNGTRSEHSQLSTDQFREQKLIETYGGIPGPFGTVQAGQSLYCVLKFCVELAAWQHYICTFSASAAQRLYARMPTYKVAIGFGLHAGWAIEGPIGSEQKIDVSYLSPTVGISEWLQDMTKEYACSVLMSDAFFNLLPPGAQKHCRQVDYIRKPGKDPMGLFAYECDPEFALRDQLINKRGNLRVPGVAIPLNLSPPASPSTSALATPTPTQPVPFTPRYGGLKISVNNPLRRAASRSPGRGQAIRSPRNRPGGPAGGGFRGPSTPTGQQLDPAKVTIPPYSLDVWSDDPDLQHSLTKWHPSFQGTWEYGFSSYLAGDWLTAKAGFEKVLGMTKGTDVPSKRLLAFMKETDFKVPVNWEGYRWYL